MKYAPRHKKPLKCPQVGDRLIYLSGYGTCVNIEVLSIDEPQKGMMSFRYVSGRPKWLLDDAGDEDFITYTHQLDAKHLVLTNGRLSYPKGAGHHG